MPSTDNELSQENLVTDGVWCQYQDLIGTLTVSAEEWLSQSITKTDGYENTNGLNISDGYAWMRCLPTDPMGTNVIGKTMTLVQYQLVF
jgi:hypothetical protein